MPGTGLSNITQRVSGLNQLRHSMRPAAPAAPGNPQAPQGSQRADGGTPFAQALQSQMTASGQVPSLAPGTTAMPAAAAFAPPVPSTPYAAGAAGAAGLAGGQPQMMPPELGANLRFTNQSSLISPVVATGLSAVQSPGLPTVDAHDHATHVHEPPALDRSGPPTELLAHGNGRIPANALEPLGIGDHSLWSPAARAFRDLKAAAERDGVTIGINDSYRSYDRQVQMVERYGLYSQGGRAASPGTSNHGWGVALDLQLDDQARDWMRDNARDYGFVEDVPREPWHWTFKASSYEN